MRFVYKDSAAVKHVWEDQHPANWEETEVARFHTSSTYEASTRMED